MPLSWNEIRSRALAFAKEWAEETSEDAEDTAIFEHRQFQDAVEGCTAADGSDLGLWLAQFLSNRPASL